jgi:hypothetical protein
MLPSATVEEREEGAFVAIYTMPMRMARNFELMAEMERLETRSDQQNKAI